jgi:hypothetical protein
MQGWSTDCYRTRLVTSQVRIHKSRDYDFQHCDVHDCYSIRFVPFIIYSEVCAVGLGGGAVSARSDDCTYYVHHAINWTKMK